MAKLHACQAFLVENIKAKDELIKNAQTKKYQVDLVAPEYPDSETANVINSVDESFGWSQLTKSEINEFLQAQAFASHIGQSIHKGSFLDKLRTELPTIPAIEWMEIEKDKKTPVTIYVHNTPEQLLNIHEKLAILHREHEQKVNYFNAKVKNLTTQENARIARVNADEINRVAKINNDRQTKFESAMNQYQEQVNIILADFEKERQETIKSLANLRIDVDTRFQETIDLFLKQLPVE